MANPASMQSYHDLLIPIGALAISILSFYFSIKSWLESNRPIVIARVTTKAGGDISTILDIIVQNVGNRPAKNINLRVQQKDLDSIILAKKGDPLRNDIEACFSAKGNIPVLENGRSVINSFGVLQQTGSTWKINSRLNVTITYQGLGRRKFKNIVPLLITDDRGFAGGFWSST